MSVEIKVGQVNSASYAEEVKKLSPQEQEDVSLFANSENSLNKTVEEVLSYVDIEPTKNSILGIPTGGYTFTTPDGTTIEVADPTNVTVKVDEDTGEVFIFGAEDAIIKGNGEGSRINIYDSSVKELDMKGGNDTIYVEDSAVDKISGGNGNDKIEVTNSTILKIDGGAGKDNITVRNSSVINEILSGDDADTISVNGSTIKVSIDGGNGNDKISVLNDSTVKNVFGGAYLGWGGIVSDDDTINVYNSDIEVLHGDSGADSINIFSGSSVDTLEGNGGDDTITGINSTIGKLFGGKDNDQINLTDMNVTELVDGSAKVSLFGLFNGQDSTTVKDSTAKEAVVDGDDNLTVSNSDVEDVTVTGNNNNVAIVNDSDVDNVGVKGDGNAVSVEDSTVEDVSVSGDGNNLEVSDSEVGTLEIKGAGNSVVVDDSTIGSVTTGRDGANFYVDDKSGLNIVDNEKNVVETFALDVQVDGMDDTSIETAQEIGGNTAAKYTDRELTEEEQYYALTIDFLSNNLAEMQEQFLKQQNEDGVLRDGYNFAKELMDLGVSEADIQAALQEQEQMINEMTAALNLESGETFPEVYERWTGVPYNEESVTEFLEVSQVYSLAANGLSRAEVFKQQVSEANSLDEVLSLYEGYYGEDKGREKLNEFLKASMVGNQEFGFPTDVEINEQNQLVVTRPNEYTPVGAIEGTEYSTTVEDISYVTNMINTMPRNFNLENVTEEYKATFEETMGYSIEALQTKYITSQTKVIGNANSFQKMLDKYCADQNGFADKLASVGQIGGMALMAVGGVVSLACPPAGIAIMKAGQYTAMASMFGDNAIDLIDDLASENGLSSEEAWSLMKESITEVALLYSGMKINGVAEGAKGVVLNATQSKALAFMAEIGTDASLSLLTDLMITGEVDLTGEGISQLLGIITGIAGAKIDSYQKQAFADADTLMNHGDIDGALAQLVATGVGTKAVIEFGKTYGLDLTKTDINAIKNGTYEAPKSADVDVPEQSQGLVFDPETGELTPKRPQGEVQEQVEFDHPVSGDNTGVNLRPDADGVEGAKIVDGTEVSSEVLTTTYEIMLEKGIDISTVTAENVIEISKLSDSEISMVADILSKNYVANDATSINKAIQDIIEIDTKLKNKSISGESIASNPELVEFIFLNSNSMTGTIDELVNMVISTKGGCTNGKNGPKNIKDVAKIIDSLQGTINKNLAYFQSSEITLADFEVTMKETGLDAKSLRNLFSLSSKMGVSLKGTELQNYVKKLNDISGSYKNGIKDVEVMMQALKGTKLFADDLSTIQGLDIIEKFSVFAERLPNNIVGIKDLIKGIESVERFNGLSKTEYFDLIDSVCNVFDDIDNYVKNFSNFTEAEKLESIRNIQSFIDKYGTVLETDTKLYRAVYFDDLNDPFYQKLSSLEEGDTFELATRDLVSTSRSIDGTSQFATRGSASYVFEINMPEGMKVLDVVEFYKMMGKSMGKFANQQEMLLPFNMSVSYNQSLGTKTFTSESIHSGEMIKENVPVIEVTVE